MKKEDIIKLLVEKGDPPPFPDIINRVQREVDNPDSDIWVISQLIASEPILAGNLIKMANSVFFGGGREQANDLNSALLRLGAKMVLDMVYSLAMPGIFPPPRSFDQKQYWKHSLAVACIARNIATPSSNRVLLKVMDEVYMAGLSHDIGMVIFDYLLPEEYGMFIRENYGAEVPLIQLEEKAFGVNHHQLGAAFIKKSWPMSDKLIAAILNQDKPQRSPIKPKGLTSVIAIAHKISDHFGMNNGIKMGPVQALSEEELQAWEMTEDDLNVLEEEIKESVEAVEIMVG
ncbi:MAG: hypothetical protein COV66_02630 [Nitrospinae bacterium CG11_big_fil_rev_8_21_14_0_20_45_15]|nr:MAG: hypothetical protein COV66_02630 [Nitrospinae bacterium CG11_big_fil_rev_8_21_14_0_20_45_15]